MSATIRPTLTLLALFTLLTGVVYPLAVTGAAQVLFPHQANGSLVLRGDQVVGSELIGQTATDPGLFWARPSATVPFPSNAASSSGSNLGPSNPALRDAIAARVTDLQEAAGVSSVPVPVDLVTASASGLDPDLSPAAAYFQVPRISRARGISKEKLEALVSAHVEGRLLGVLGEPRVNALTLNLALLKLAADNEERQLPP